MRCAQAVAGELTGVSQGRSWFDVLPHFNFLAFDIIGDLAFGAPFGMIAAQKDVAPMLDPTTVGEKPEIKYVSAVRVLNDRGDYSASMGVLPAWCLAGMAVAAVEKRLKFGLPEEASDEDEGFEDGVLKRGRNDLLEKLMQGKDENGEPMGREELTAEALQQLIAGSDTTSNSSCAITYYLAANPACQRRLQAELDNNLPRVPSAHPPITQSGAPPLPPPQVAARFADIKSLPYLQACINEGLRLHSTSGVGLPRVIPPGLSLEIGGERFNEGTILSVPTYSVHHSEEVWGEDSELYRPERWLERDVGKEFNPFSYGPRACVGRNLANMEMLLIIGSLFHRYEFELHKPEQKLLTREGFLRKPLECKIIRIAPNHISIADPKAIEPIYGHGSGMFKSDFYDAFVSIRASLFTTRDRAAHARKRKVVSSVLSQQNVLQFEPLIRKHVRLLLAQWDLKCAKGQEKNERAWFNVPPKLMPYPGFSFLAFGVTADLTFGASFGMIEAQRDIAPMLQLSESNT
ncbi:cytochrome P450 family protein [Ceratobasidium sp. AG-Ba]|nr:cytochrome P450 family protein [Ceratobasidium sp. AG-Ba]